MCYNIYQYSTSVNKITRLCRKVKVVMKNLMDLHVHTRHSFDSEEAIEPLCKRADELGLAAFAVTDHCDVNAQPLAEARALISASAADVRRMQGHCQAEIFTGVELGEPLENPAYAEEILGLAPYDVVLGSVHNLPGMEDFYFMDCSTLDIPAVMEPYFEELIRLAQWGKCDIITHITYPLRYIEGKYRREVNLEPFLPLMDELFRTMIEKGIALEVNASGLRQEIGRPLPDERFLKRYYDLGGRKLVFGSDAHAARDLAAGIPACREMALRLGFTESVAFRRREEFSLPLA